MALIDFMPCPLPIKDGEFPLGDSYLQQVTADLPNGSHDEIRLLLNSVQKHVLRFHKEEESERGTPPQDSAESYAFLILSSTELVAVVEKALIDSLSPANCIYVRAFSTLHTLPRLTAACDGFIQANFSKMLSMGERELVGLPRVQVNLDVSEHAEDLWSSEVNVLERVVPSVVQELAHYYLFSASQLHVEEKLVNMELVSDFSVQMNGSHASKKHSSETPEKPTSCINLSKKQPSPARRLHLGGKEEADNHYPSPTVVGDPWEIISTHSMLGMGAMTVVRRSNNLLLLNIQMVTKGAAKMVCPISPTTGIPLATKEAFFSQMDQSRSGFGLVPIGHSLVGVGGFNRQGVLRSVESFDLNTNSWVPISNLSVPRARLAVVKHSDCVYAIGGSDGRSELNSVEVLSDLRGTWKTSPSKLVTARSDFGATVLDNCVYVVGGAHYSSYLRSTEMFDHSKKQWRQMAPMSTPRKGAAVVSCSGCVYAIGGQNSSWGCLNSAECYNPTENKWREIAPLSMPRRNASAVAADGRIYIIGGYNGSKAIDCIEIYDPASEEWTCLEPMVLKRSSAAAVLLQDAVYVIGGFSGSIFLNSIEKYDLESEQWTSYFSST